MIILILVFIDFSSSFVLRYAYSDDGSEEFDKDDSLTLIKPSPLPSMDVRSQSEMRPVNGGGGGLSNGGDLEEDKTA